MPQLQFQASIVGDGPRVHSGVGELTLYVLDVGPTADLPRPVEISLTLPSQSCPSFSSHIIVTTSGMLFSFFPVICVFFLHLPIQSIASIY